MWEAVAAWVAKNVLAAIVGAIVTGGTLGALGVMVFGPDYKARIATLEAKAARPPPMQVMVHGDQIVVGNKPVARFSQALTMYDKVVPLSNGQILTFFMPEVSVEYQSGGEEIVHPLPPPDFERVVQQLSQHVQANPRLMDEWEPLHLRPDTLRRLLREAEEELATEDRND